MLQPREPILLWRRQRRRHGMEILGCSTISSTLVVIGCLTLLAHGLTQHKDDVFIVKPTPALRLGKEELTTVLLVNNENHGRFINVRPEVGLLTSTARTFIQEGVTTEYATQVVGTTLDNGRVYAQYLKKSSRVLYDNGVPLPSVVTSWVGESLHSDAGFLPQSHNDLFDADLPDWQAIDDRLLSDRRHHEFVGNTDYVGLRRKSLLPSNYRENEEIKPLDSSLVVDDTKNLKPADNFVAQLGILEGNAPKVAAQKVLPVGDLPTYTIKQNYESKAYLSSNDDTELEDDNESGEAFGRNPKLIYKKLMQSSVRSENKSYSRHSPKPLILASRHFATVTYYGFADFTTVVGDSVIVFSPSTSTRNMNYNAHVTSIKGEATLGAGLPQSPSVSKNPIEIAQDIIEQTITQQILITTLLDTVTTTVEEMADVKETSSALNTINIVENDLNEKEMSPSILETSEVIVQSTQSFISSTKSTATDSTVMLSRPSDEEILRIFNALANADAKSKMQSISGDITSALTTSSSIDEVHLESSNIQIFGGATTIFFEDDSFANFVDPSKTKINIDSTISSYNTSFMVSTSYEDSKQEPTTTNTSIEVSTEQNIDTEITTDNPLSTFEANVDIVINDTITTQEPDTRSTSQAVNNLEVVLSSVLIKEIDPIKDIVPTDCTSTSQVFLTQLPKMITLFETVVATDSSMSINEVISKIHPTFEIKEATKYYCIQASAIQANQLETPLVNPTLSATEKGEIEITSSKPEEGFEIAFVTEKNNEEDKTETSVLNTTEENILKESEQPDIEKIEGDIHEHSGNGVRNDPDDDEREEEDDEESSGQLGEDDEDDEEIELIYKTLYTTYTYLTTFFHDDSTSISSHTEVVTNIMTSTLGISSTKYSLATNLIANLDDNEINPRGTFPSTITESTKRFVVPSEVESFIRTDEDIYNEGTVNSIMLNNSPVSSKSSETLATFYTTYTYYTTIFAEGETDIMSHTEVITNIKKSPATAKVEAEKILPTISSYQKDENPLSTISTEKYNITDYRPIHETELSSTLSSETNLTSSSAMAILPNIPELGDLSAITLVTDVRSSSSSGDKKIINNFESKLYNYKVQQQSILEDQISSESNTDTDEIIPSATLLLQTSFTTFTYYTTMYSGDKTNVITRLETLTNTVTETLQPSKTIDLEGASVPITYFTTFTYWTKLAREGQITTLSREETISNIVIPTSVQQETESKIELFPRERENVTEKATTTEASLIDNTTTHLSKEDNKTTFDQTEMTFNKTEVQYATNVLEATTYYTTYTYYTTSYETDQTITDSRFETVTNIITPTMILTNISNNTKDTESPIIAPYLTQSLTQSNIDQSKSETFLYDFKKIIDADGISTLFFTTEIKPTINSNGVVTKVISSTSSIFINEEKRSMHASASAANSTPDLGQDGQILKQYKTGLVRLIEGTRIANRTTTLYQSKVIGTVIDQRYAQIIESTSSFIFEKTNALADTSSLNTIITPTSSNNIQNIQATDQASLPVQSVAKVEGSVTDSSLDQEIVDTTTKAEMEGDEDNYQKTDEKLRFPFQTKKPPFVSPLKPFLNRSRPQFAPKKNSSATIITRSDFTPTITATPALKTISRFSSTRRGSVSGIASSNSVSSVTSSRRFGRPSKSSVTGAGLQTSSALGSINFSGASRNRFASSPNARGTFASSSRRIGGSAAAVRASFSRPSLFSSGFPGNSRQRIKPSVSAVLEEVLPSVDISTSAPLSSQEEEFSQAQADLDEEEENTTESNRRQNNPLLRLRRPLNRPQGFAPARSQQNTPNNAVSSRRNPLISRPRNSATVTTPTTTATTAKPKPRTFQPPLITKNRIRTTNTLFPPRNIFGVQKPEVTTEENRDLSEEDTNENNDDSEYEDDDDEEPEGDEEEENNRRRRSNSKAELVAKQKNRNKREADTSLNRSNFRNRFRRPKLASHAQTESNKDDGSDAKEVVTTAAPQTTSPQRTRSRFGARYIGHSSSPTTTTSTSPVTSANHKAIRPTRPTSNGRAQFTLREKDSSAMSTTQKGLTSVKLPAFRRPQPKSSLSSSRRLPSSTVPSASPSGKRRLKSYVNNDSTTTSRNSVTGRSRPSSSTSSGRSRPSGTSRENNIGGRNRGRSNHNYNSNNEPAITDNSGTITVTHVIPADVTIPVVNGKVTEYKQVVTAKTSTEVLGPHQYTSTIAANGALQLALTREDSSVNFNGATEVTQYILHETLTTTITFTPTTIRGRKTSFSHVLPSTVYSVEQVLSTVQPQLSANAPLANILLSQLLLGNVGLPAGNPLLGALGGALTNHGLGTAVGPPQPATPVTEYKTHASTYVTTVVEGQSTVLPVTFQASQAIHKQFQHFDSGQDGQQNAESVDRDAATLKTSHYIRYSEYINDSINNNIKQSQNANIDEARYNLATRIMSNGVEVIIASDKTKTQEHVLQDISNSQIQYNKPVTLAASTIKNQMMILLFPSSQTAAENNFVMNQSIKQLYPNLSFHTNHFITKTCLTTYTYRTTYVQDGSTTVESREKVISNIATEERNYPKITPSQTIGITLTRTPELAVGIFPTTYSYFNTFKDNSDKLQVITSEYTVVNTITGPNDYVAYLQPTAKATPALKTNTYYNVITISQKIKSKMYTVKRNLTQVVVTKSFMPTHSTSVFTSYYAYDEDVSKYSTSKFITSSLPSNEEATNTVKISVVNLKDKSKILDNIHIYATRTFLTTFTYYTTTILNSYYSESSQTELDITPLSTVFNYYTRVIENVITDSVPVTLLPNEVLTKMKLELRKQTPNQRRRVIVTTATLKDGQIVKISAVEMFKGNFVSSLFSLSPTLSSSFSTPPPPAVNFFNNSLEKLEGQYQTQEDADAYENFTLETSNSSGHSSSVEHVKYPNNQEEENNGLASLPSEQILTVVEASNYQLSSASTPVIVYETPSTLAASQLIQRLTALKPMFNAMADLLQNNFGVTRKTVWPIQKNVESKQASVKKINYHAANSTQIDKTHLKYIPVQKSEINKSSYGISNYSEFIPQSLHIKPPLLVNEESSFEADHLNNSSKLKLANQIPLSTLKAPRLEQPLHNGGIYIRPGDIITANSDVIIGKPNGIENAQIPYHFHIDKNISNAHIPDNQQFQVTYYNNKVQHPYKKKSFSALTKITHKPQHIPLANGFIPNSKFNQTSSFGLRPPYEKMFNKNILKPPPLPPTLQSLIPVHSQQGLSLLLTAPDIPTRTRNKQQKTNTFIPAESTMQNSFEIPLSSVTPLRQVHNFYNFNNELQNNEILETQQLPQVLSVDLKPSSLQTQNIPKLSNKDRKPPSHTSSPQNKTNTDLKLEKKPTSLSWESRREPQISLPFMRLQPGANIVGLYTEKDKAFQHNFSKLPITLSWKNSRAPQIKTSTSPSYIHVEQKPNIGIIEKNSKPENQLTGSSIIWSLQPDSQPQIKTNFSYHQMGTNINPSVQSSTNFEELGTFYKNPPSASNGNIPYNTPSIPILNNKKIEPKQSLIYFNESLTSNHQNVSLDQHILSHTVDVNVPPLTFNREDHDYPQQASTAVKGQIPPATLMELKTQSIYPYKYMPLITIPENKQQVQVSLTPFNSVGSLTLPTKIQTVTPWNSEIASNEPNSNNIVRKISLLKGNLQSDQFQQDQKTFASRNVLNIKPKYDEHSNWKYHRRQEELHNTRLNSKSQALTTTKKDNINLRQVEEKKSQTELYLKSKPNRVHQQSSVSVDVSHGTSIPSFNQVPMKSMHKLETVASQSQHYNKSNNTDRFTLHDPKTGKDHKHAFPTEVQPPETNDYVLLKPKTSKEQNRKYRDSIQKSDHSGQKINNNPFITSSTTMKPFQKATTKKPTAKDINEIIIINTKQDDESIQVPAILTQGEPFSKSSNNYMIKNYETLTKISNRNKSATIFVASGEAFRLPESKHNSNVKINTTKSIDNSSKTLSPNSSPQEVFLTRETQYSFHQTPNVFTKAPTKTSTLLNIALSPLQSTNIQSVSSLSNAATTETVYGLQSSPSTIPLYIKNTTSKTDLPNILLSSSNENIEMTKKRQQNKMFNSTKNIITGEIESKDNTLTRKTQTYKQNGTEQDEYVLHQDIITNIKNNAGDLKLRNHLNLASKKAEIYLENESPKANDSFKLLKLQPSESYKEKVTTPLTSPLFQPILKFTTTTIKRIILPTKYITSKSVYRVTTTAFAPLSTYVQSTSSILPTTETTTEVTTVFLTHTEINSVVDTATSMKSLVPITITATTTLKTLVTESSLLEFSSINTQLPNLASQEPFLSSESHSYHINQDLTYLPYPSVEVVSTNMTPESNLNPIENSIFIIMTNQKNKKNAIVTHPSKSQVDNTIPLELSNDNENGQIDEASVMIEYDNRISFDDIPFRDEESEHILHDKSVAFSAIVNDVASVKESSTDDHIILGGVLIATPPKSPTKHTNVNESTNGGCHPKCKASRNEQCDMVDNQWSCLCRPSFARMFPDRPCKPTYTHDLLLHVVRVGSYPLQYVDELKDNKTYHYKQLSQLVNNALDRMLMQSDFRDSYHGVEVTQFSDGHKNHHGVLINVLLQLSDNSNEKRLEEVFKKHLRLSNYSIGGTDLYTNKAGVDRLAIKDFNECLSRKLNDCSENAHCFNLPGTYTCSCIEGFADLSDNPIYPGRICSSELIGCEMCHYHGKCFYSRTTWAISSNDQNYCECFSWYAGSKCQVNLKILLIVLLGIGTLLFILLLFCILITCTKRRNNLQHTTLAPSTVTTSSDGLQKKSRIATNLVITSVGLHSSVQGGTLHNNKRQKSLKIEKRSIIKDSSSESSQNSLPCALKNRDSIKESCTKKKTCHLKNSKKFRNYSQKNTMEQYSVSVPSNIHIENKCDLSSTMKTSSFKGNNHQTEQKNFLGNAIEYEGHYCDQSDRSLTVMIPRAKYHSSILSQTQLMHHQLTLERILKTAKPEHNLANADEDANVNKTYKKNLPNTKEISSEEIPTNPGALISAGFEVSAIVRDNIKVINSVEQSNNDLVQFDLMPPYYNNLTTSDGASSLESNSGQKDSLSADRHQHILSKQFSMNESDYNVYKCDKDSAEARSFDETIIRPTTKPVRISVDGTHKHQIHDEVNTMAERDLGSTVLLPHTHLYKPERQESELSGFDSF